MEKLKREREGHRDSVKMKRLAGVGSPACGDRGVEAGTCKEDPTCLKSN